MAASAGLAGFGVTASLLALLASAAAVPAPAAAPAAPVRGLDVVLRNVQEYASAATAYELLDALNSSAGSSTGQMITLQDHIVVRPEDVQPFAAHLPLNGGNRTVVLRGGERSGNQTLLDWGGAVYLLYHPAGHSFFTYGLIIQGLAPISAGYAAGLKSQMVGGAFWPTTTGEPGHLMAFYNTTIRTVSPSCSRNSTEFTVASLRQVLGRNDTVAELDAHTFFVGQQLNGSYAVRVIDTGGAAGNVRWSWDNTTVHCDPLPKSGAPEPPSPPQQAAEQNTAATGVAATADELLGLLAAPNVNQILLGGHVSLRGARWDCCSLPIVLQGRQLTIQSNDATQKVLDFGRQIQLLYLSAGSSLTFSGLQLQGAAAPSAAIANRSRIIVGSPLWPTVDGETGHQLLFLNSTVTAIITPCSRNSTALNMDLLTKVLGPGSIQPVGDTAYTILPRFRQIEPIRSTITREQVGSTPYTFERATIRCEEDPEIGLAAELQAMSHAGGGRGSVPPWVPAVVAVSGALALAAAAVAAALVLRRRRAAARTLDAAAGGAAQAPPPPGTPGSSKIDGMESGELKDAKMAPDSPIPNFGQLSGGSGGGLTSGSLTPGGTLRSDRGKRSHPPLWRTRFGMIEGLEVGELLGRGAYGKVYKGRWNGAIVAVKVVEHRVAAGEPDAISREPLLCMSVSHPNCITTYKLSVIRLLRGDDLLDPDDSVNSLPTASDIRLSAGTDVTEDTAWASGAGSQQGGRRRVRSLLSGAEAVEVADPYGPLQPGLYETWIVSEYCERGTLGDVLAEKKLALPDGRPNMASVYLCLLDIASGIQYLHSLGIIHGDLKPANVLLKGLRNTRGFTCKLADFGLSRMLDGRATHVETGSYGTPTHAAPELLREGRLSPAVDTFAFGVLAWELVAGEEAWRGQHPMQIILQVTQQGARPPALPHCPPPLAALMARCWADEPAGRPTFSELLPELLAQLQQVRQEQQVAGATRLAATTSLATGSELSTSSLPEVGVDLAAGRADPS